MGNPGSARLYAGNYAFRNVPSAGCRHALETYWQVFNVESSQREWGTLNQGYNRYLP